MHGTRMIIGISTEVIAREGMIVTARVIDCHVHFICPQLAYEAMSSGMTTLVSSGTGPADGTHATTCTSASSHMKFMLQSADDLPLNFGSTGKGNIAKPDRLHEIIRTWQTAHEMKSQRGSLDASGVDNDNLRIKRCVAKYTISPARPNGFSRFVGSIEVGKVADFVLWNPSFFRAKPEMVIKGGVIAWANMG